MNFQEKYANYYNLIYQNKNYTGEVEYILSLLNKYQPNLKTILELGCGTGKHALILSEKGYQVDGVDLSDEMISIAHDQRQRLPQNIASNVQFEQGDLRTVRMGKKYDAIVSLFHVMSYQTSNEDLSAAFATAKAHLKPGGVFLFDCWYGPGVLSDRPTTRIKRLENTEVSMVRIAEPVMIPNENIVNVNYEIIIKDKKDLTSEHFCEIHQMRYLFQPEVKLLLEQHNFELLQCNEWITNANPSFSSWEVCFLARA
jgi:SAM-dependent methyltransferase